MDPNLGLMKELIFVLHLDHLKDIKTKNFIVHSMGSNCY